LGNGGPKRLHIIWLEFRRDKLTSGHFFSGSAVAHLKHIWNSCDVPIAEVAAVLAHAFGFAPSAPDTRKVVVSVGTLANRRAE